jgi:hypothetical protein
MKQKIIIIWTITCNERFISFHRTAKTTQISKNVNNEDNNTKTLEMAEEREIVDFDLDEEIKKKQQELQQQKESEGLMRERSIQPEDEVLQRKGTKKKQVLSSNVSRQHIPETRNWTPEEIESLKSNYLL